MKTLTSVLNSRPTIGLLILALATSCYSYKPIVKSSTKKITGSELETKIAPDKIYKIVLKKRKNESVMIVDVFVKIKKVTADTMFCDVSYIRAAKLSWETETLDTYQFKNVSQDGKPTNKNWLWADPYKRLVGLGRLSINSISEVREEKFSRGKTAILVTGIVLTPIIIMGIALSNSDLSGTSIPLNFN